MIWLALESAIILFAYLTFSETVEVFRYAARYSGRLLLLAYLAAIWFYMLSKMQSDAQLNGTRSLTLIFAMLHYIYLYLLWMNVNLNSIALVPYKLAGGALAYLLILLYPIFFERFKHNKAVRAVDFIYLRSVHKVQYRRCTPFVNRH